MAEVEVKQEIVGGDEEKSRQQFPPGFRFAPTDDEMVEHYLLPRLQGRPHVPNYAIIDDYVYRCHPDELTLNGKHKDRGQDDVWYFLSSRARKYVNGARPSRMTDDGRGRWKASTGADFKVSAVRKVKYTYSNLGYHDGPIKEEDKGKWLMREFTIPEYGKKVDKNGDRSRSRSGRDTLDDYVMCKIYMTKRKKKEEEAGPSGTSEDTCPAAQQPWPVESCQDTSRETAKRTHSERRKGKRPVEDRKPKQASPSPVQCLGPQAAADPIPAQFYGGGMQARFGATGYQYHYRGAGRPMAYNTHTAMARPPVAFDGQVPPYQAAPAAAPGVLGQAMMMRHLDLGGQAFRPPPLAAVQGYPAVQRQPETEEMRKRRVYQQHMNELMMMQGMMQRRQPVNAAYAAHQPRPMAFMQHHQQPCFGGGVNHYPVRPMGLQYLPCNYHQPVEEAGQQVQFSYAVSDSAETGVGSIGATIEEGDVGGNDEDKGSAEAATMKVLPPDRTTAPADGDDTEQDSPH